MSNKIYKDAVGVIITIDMGEDISDATKTDILVKKGEGSTDTWEGYLYGTNYIRYVTEEDDLDEAGIYHLQPDLEIGTWSGKGETVTFKIYESWR